MMVKTWQRVIVLMGVWALAQPLSETVVEAQVSGLSPYFYDETCPEVFAIVADGVWDAIQIETRNAASLLRLHFHDCFVQGCDGSILLAATANFASEQTALPNLNSVRGYNFIDSIKASLESWCPGVVSCADIVALSAFFSVVLSGGPAWWVPLGRRDSLTAASNVTVLQELIGPDTNLSIVRQKFANQSLSTTDLVALQGAHTIGIGRCISILTRVYNFSSTGEADPTLNTTLLKKLEANCPDTNNSNAGNVTNPMDITTPTTFDNSYFRNLLEGNGLFQTDEELFTAGNDTKTLVELYASDQTKFFEDFAQSMINMGNLNVSTGTNGEIRKNCSLINPVSSIIQEMVNVGSEPKSEKTRTVEKTESAAEFFKEVVKNTVMKIVEKELVKMEEIIEETIEAGYSSK